ncbi:Schwann cell myelin protein-like isoform X4 [Oncorhynchus kisutch]|uniref:Schwann cell myelin protein-like isoform X4 n=1 Tax=Oncorhynchus kisutch TaxID=8019 RepID=UPI0012DD46C2|nr:Schwann cell myelin protein-like isoform X4 [Oncorhynchus kisutch]
MACPENMFFLIVLFISGVLACFGKRDLITTMPDRLDVLAGSCVQIPCSFDIPDQHKDKFNSTILTSGVWIKENLNFRERPDNVIFNSSKMVNRYQGEITGNISQKNCTTVFFNVTTNYTDKYYLRIESQPYRATDPDKSVEIDVSGQKEPKNPMVFGVAAGTLGAILLISLISLFVWGRNSRLHDGLERTDSPQGQNSPVGTVCTNQATAGEEPEKPAEDQPEEIHYGAIDFSKRQTKETPAAAQDRVQGQESEYAEVNVTGRGAQEPPLNNLDGLYAQVNKISAC